MDESFKEEIITEEVIEEKPSGPPTVRESITEALKETSPESEKPKISTPEPETKEVLEPLKAPHSWSKDDAKHFETLPRPTQEVILRRESERDKGIQQKFEEAARLQKRYQELDEVLEPHQTALGLDGKTPAQLVREHLAAEELLRTNPIAGIQWFCHHYGVSPQQLINGIESQPKVDPHVQTLMQEIAQLKGYLSTQHQQNQLEYVKSLKDEVHSFATEKDANGSLAHPHWDAVEPQMPNMIHLARTENPQANARALLEMAYKKAIRLNDDVWAKEQQRELDKRKAENNAKAQAAKKASASIAGAPIGTDKVSTPKDLRSVIELAVDGRL